MTNIDDKNACGRATFDPTGDVLAGSYGTWRLTYRAGPRGINTGGRLVVHTDTDTDWGIPQFVDPTDPDYMTVETPQGVRAAVRVVNAKKLELAVHGRSLKPDETVTLVFGDRSAGSPGSRAQTFLEEKHYLWIDVDVDGRGDLVTLADSPCFAVVGDEAVRLVLVAPSTAVVDEPFRLLIKAEDRWGNPSPSYRGTIQLSGDGFAAGQRQIVFSVDDRGAKWIEGFQTSQTGLLTIGAADPQSGLEAMSNPILSSEQAGAHRLCWADAHGGQVVLASKIAGFFRYARDVSGVQFVGYQRNADCISSDDWEVQQQQERAFYQPGRFVPIPGFEWSGRTWDGGHHNVYFRRHGQPVRRNAPAETPKSVDEKTELPHIRDVYAEYRGADLILTPHVGGEHSNLTWHEPTLEPAVEVSSSHGSFEWMLFDALERGYRLGFLGGSDSYTGRPGDDRPGYQLRRYSKAGLTGIYAADITIDGFIEAMRARRVYATTGVRMVLRSEADGHFMGSEYRTSEPPKLAVSVAGTAPLERVELFRGLEKIYTFPIESRPEAKRVRVLWNGSSRMTSYSGVVWDGSLTLTGGTISSVETLRFDSPRSHIVDQTENSVRWHAWGCGYPMALLLDVQTDGRAELQLAFGTQTITGPAYGRHGSRPPRRISLAPAEGASLQVNLQELADGPAELDLGVLDRKVCVSLVPESGPTTAEFEFVDESPAPGINPYWIRVMQSDLEMGWTSPVFVDYAPKVSS